MKYCTICGKPIEPGNTFCTNCGKEVPAGDHEPEEPVDVSQAPSEEAVSATPPMSTSGPRPKGERGPSFLSSTAGKITIVVIALMVVAGVAVGVIFATRNGGNGAPATAIEEKQLEEQREAGKQEEKEKEQQDRESEKQEETETRQEGEGELPAGNTEDEIEAQRRLEQFLNGFVSDGWDAMEDLMTPYCYDNVMPPGFGEYSVVDWELLGPTLWDENTIVFSTILYNDSPTGEGRWNFEMVRDGDTWLVNNCGFAGS